MSRAQDLFVATLLVALALIAIVVRVEPAHSAPNLPGYKPVTNDYIGGFHGADVYRITDGNVVCYLTKHPEHPNTSISCVVIPGPKSK